MVFLDCFLEASLLPCSIEEPISLHINWEVARLCWNTIGVWVGLDWFCVGLGTPESQASLARVVVF
jgi:hypothetical protein